MPVKRKAVAQSAKGAFGSKKGKSEDVVADETAEIPEPEEDAPAEDADEEVEEKPKERTAAQQEKDTVEARKQELKSMYVEQIKELMSSFGLEMGNRNYMMDKIAAHEAKVRAVQREKDAQIRAVIVSKKEEIDALSVAEVKKLCDNAGVKGSLSRVDRVQELMKLWQAAEGVDKALQKITEQKRHAQLVAMEPTALLKMCKKANLDPYVKDVMVSRIVRKEYEAGHFARPLAEPPVVPSSTKRNGDVIDDFLAQETNRKKVLELKKQRDEFTAKRFAELNLLALDKLQKLVEKNGLDSTGSKAELIVAVVKLDDQKAAIDARKKELKSMGKDVLTDLVASKGVKKGSVDSMVDAFVAVEEKRRAEVAAYEIKVDEVVSKKKAELEAMNGAKLKELCASKGLKTGGNNDDRLTSLINDARDDVDVHKTLEKQTRDARKEALMAMDKSSLLQLCEEYGADPHVPEVMAELVFEHEVEAGKFHDKESVAKKARTSK